MSRHNPPVADLAHSEPALPDDTPLEELNDVQEAPDQAEKAPEAPVVTANSAAVTNPEGSVPTSCAHRHLRADIATLEAGLSALHEGVARAGLHAYQNPTDAEAASEAKKALEALRAATDRLDQLRASAALAEANEAAAERAAIDAKMLTAYERAEKAWGAAVEKAMAATEKFDHQSAILRAEQGCLDFFANQWVEQEPVVEKAKKLAGDLEWAADELWDRVGDLADTLAAMPRSLDEQEAAAEMARVAAEQETEDARLAYEADTERQLAEAYNEQLIDVPAPFRFIGDEFAEKWTRAYPEGATEKIKRKDVPQHEKRMAQAAAWYVKNVEPYETVLVPGDQIVWKLRDGIPVYVSHPKGVWVQR